MLFKRNQPVMPSHTDPLERQTFSFTQRLNDGNHEFGGVSGGRRVEFVVGNMRFGIGPVAQATDDQVRHLNLITDLRHGSPFHFGGIGTKLSPQTAHFCW